MQLMYISKSMCMLPCVYIVGDCTDVSVCMCMLTCVYIVGYCADVCFCVCACDVQSGVAKLEDPAKAEEDDEDASKWVYDMHMVRTKIQQSESYKKGQKH